MLLAIDQGTTGTTCLVVDSRGHVVGRAYRELRQSFPRPGWVEHDPRELWALSRAVAGEALDAAGVRPGGLAGVGIANQRETVVVWDPATGEPLHPALVWQDRRTAATCDALRASGLEPRVRDRTGLILDPYFSATKVQWLLEHVDGLAQRARDGRAVFGTVDAWLIARLSGGRAFVTEPSNASRTLLYDTAEGRWDPELCARFGVPERALPELRASCGELARTDPAELFGHAVPIAGVLGDQQAALFGQGCLKPGAGKATLGTGAFVLSTLETRPAAAPEGLLSTVAWQIGDEVTHAVEAAIFVAGAAVQWLRDGLGIIAAADETEGLAAALDGNDGVYFVPALTGLGSPHWDPYARGTVVGLTRGTGRAHLARAALEAIAYQVCDAVRAMEGVSGEPLHELRVDGGATANGWLMRFTADVLGVPVVVPAVPETTALGAALMAGVGVGLIELADVGEMGGAPVRHAPSMREDARATLLDGWHRALSRSRGWAVE